MIGLIDKFVYAYGIFVRLVFYLVRKSGNTYIKC